MDLHWTFSSPRPSIMGGVKEVSSISINGKNYPIADHLDANMSLNEFLRNHAHLKGTKYMCLEGGCGACIVTVQSKHPTTGKTITYAVNSCLVPLFACQGWKITTIEGVGNKNVGYHDVQTRLAMGNGSQCGYCSVGMVMNMYSLLKENPKLTMAEIENSFGGNLCRCTGYRPILDSFKSFAEDAPTELVKKCSDIEDLLSICPLKKKPCRQNGACNGGPCQQDTEVVDWQDYSSGRLELQNGFWYYVNDKKEIFEILDMCDDSDYMLVGGNTAHGVYRRSPVKHYISTSNVAQLHSIVEAGGTIVLGANNSLTATMEFFYKKSVQDPKNFGYLKTLADHIDVVANVPVRNTGTLAGNLSIKNQHKEFPSDIFLMLETVRAVIVCEDAMEQETTMSPLEFRDFDMTKKLMTKIIMPSINSDQYICRTFKITPRAQNAHAYVNAGFLFKVDKKNKYKILEKPNIVFGGITPGFVHATAAENESVGKELLDPNTLKSVLQKLSAEIKPDHEEPDASPEFRRGLACSLFYKFVLGVSPQSLAPPLRSGGEILTRPVSSGHQEISTDPSLYPVSKPIPKIEALAQCSGEAEYANDIPNQPNEVYGAFVLSTKGPADSFTLDASEALKLPGVVAVHTAKDIPGRNSVLYPVAFGGVVDEPLYADKKIPCAGYPLATVFAESHTLAMKAANLVKVTYQGVQKPEIDVKKIVEGGDKNRIWGPAAQKKADSVKTNVKHKVKGSFWMPSQYHFTMETQTCVTLPSEDGLDVYPATQCPTQVQDGIAEACGIPRNSVNLSIRRCGGGYGSKLGKSGVVAVACALGAYQLQRPVRMVMSIESNMDAIGKRAACLFKYETGVDDDGLIQYLNINYYQDDGWNKNDTIAPFTIHHMNSIYDTTTWTINGYGVTTDLPSQTWCRAPGFVAITVDYDNVSTTTGSIHDFDAIMEDDDIALVAQVVAYTLGVPVESISVKPTLSLTAPNAAPTGGSGGSESACYAAKKACEELLSRLEPIKKENPNATWKELVAKAMGQQVNLNATYMFTPKDDVKSYSIYGVAVLEVLLDILTGQFLITRVDILEDCGTSLSPEVDIGQIEGAYVMGLGLYTSEDLIYDHKTGRNLTNRTWTYKVPGAKDIPIDFRVQMRQNAPNPVGVLKSKATGEPPLNMSIGVVFALRRCLESARVDSGLPDQYLHIDPPLTTERIWLNSGNSIEQFKL
ncbi:uncharacterized protein LOC128999016 [Macrosteles quadrilineatus]|uniref:uncharacterized protein LOC128999016 n=1 Tax=Macrosteles quadrilineatus TaxID=74068 RepID=UPI0023E3415B|nr:uncharacterized protein LOC128999016 [Macrosteles quadrilineatus]